MVLQQRFILPRRIKSPHSFFWVTEKWLRIVFSASAFTQTGTHLVITTHPPAQMHQHRNPTLLLKHRPHYRPAHASLHKHTIIFWLLHNFRPAHTPTHRCIRYTKASSTLSFKCLNRINSTLLYIYTYIYIHIMKGLHVKLTEGAWGSEACAHPIQKTL